MSLCLIFWLYSKTVELEYHKYSTRHIALLAKAFGYKNIADLMNFPTPQYDKIKVTVRQTMNESGTKVLSSEVVKIEPLK